MKKIKKSACKILVIVLLFTLSISQSVQAQVTDIPFSKNLRFGIRNEDVKRLQEYLNSHNFPVAKSGLGSAGHETTYFGPKTRAALMLFQQHFAEKILKPLGRNHATGNFYTSTRNFINSLLSPVVTQATQPDIQPIVPPPKNVELPKNSQTHEKLYTVGGMATGMTGPLILENDGETLTLQPVYSGNFQFLKKFTKGQNYSVKVVQNPQGQRCPIMSGGNGIIANADISDIKIVCTNTAVSNPPMTYSGGLAGSSPRRPFIQTYTVEATVSGISGTVVLQNNGRDNVTVNANGSFIFSTRIAKGSTYNVTVLTQPETQTCTVTNGSGTMGSSNITNVGVTCSTNAFTVGGTVSGLSGTVVLQNNGGDNLMLSANGSLTFATPIAEGATYNVTVLTQPETQTCNVINGSGMMGGSNVTNVFVTCSTNTFTVGGTVSGLSGTVVLQNNGTGNMTINANGSFTFSTPITEGSPYNVTVLTQPEAQTCNVINGSGTMGDSNITNVSVTCSTNAFTVGGNVSGLSGSVVLQNNGGDNLTLSANGSLTFATSIAEGSPYNVTVLTQPETQTCTVTNGSGTMGSSNITNVGVACSTNTFTVGGNVSGLSGSVVLQNNGGDNLTINANGSLTFATPVAEGSSYNVTVLTQPENQTCNVTNESGIMGGSNVTNVSVTCSTNTYTVGGTVSALLGSLVLQNNAGDNLIINANGSFTFPTPLLNGASYSVTVLSKPINQNCTVMNGSGTISGNNVTNITINCTLDPLFEA